MTYHNTTKAAYRSIPQSKGSSLESEASSTTQESPLDLSVRSSISSSTGGLKNPLAASMDSIQSSSGTAPASSSSTASILPEVKTWVDESAVVEVDQVVPSGTNKQIPRRLSATTNLGKF